MDTKRLLLLFYLVASINAEIKTLTPTLSLGQQCFEEVYSKHCFPLCERNDECCGISRCIICYRMIGFDRCNTHSIIDAIVQNLENAFAKNCSESTQRYPSEACKIFWKDSNLQDPPVGGVVDDTSTKMSLWITITIVVGVALFLMILATVCFCFTRKRKETSLNRETSDISEE